MPIAPFAIYRPGPAHKVGYGALTRSRKEGLVAHSMEGPLAAALAELDRPERQASWHFSVARGGEIYQHYDTDLVVWASGSLEANRRFVAVEHEGWAGERLTPQQVEALARVIAWCADVYGWKTIERQVTLWEHREMTRFGSAPTACPSGRIPWPEVLTAVARLQSKGGGESMPDPRLDEKVRYRVIGPALNVVEREGTLADFLRDLANGYVILPTGVVFQGAVEAALDTPTSILGEPPEQQQTVRRHIANLIAHVFDREAHGGR
ncbi:hypothetical protein HRbin24_00542 [bacterium HR24]|nr:hypothetical protein HRbin24_00542 [bacterium HR24]